MRLIALLFSLAICIIGCQNPKTEEITSLPPNPAILSVVQYLADSAVTCTEWLEKDYQIRKFFTNSDSVADFLSNNFSHDQIVAWFKSLDTTGIPDLKHYLIDLDLAAIQHVDSIAGCANAINALAFSHDGKEALILFVQFSQEKEETFTLLLEQPQEGGWYIADTLNQASQYKKVY